MTLRTLNYGNYGIFLIMGNTGFIPSTVRCPLICCLPMCLVGVSSGLRASGSHWGSEILGGLNEPGRVWVAWVVVWGAEGKLLLSVRTPVVQMLTTSAFSVLGP